MSIKTLKARFQIANCDGSLGQALVTIKANGLEVFSGYLAETLDVFSDQILSTLTPYSEAQFDLDVPDWVAGQAGSVSIPMEFTVTGGDMNLQGIYSNYCIGTKTDPNDPTQTIPVAGDADTFCLYDIDTQPLVNGEIITGRYNIDDNFNLTGPGCIFIFRDELVSIGAYIQKFNDTIPVV
jgi:hypothetical protein